MRPDADPCRCEVDHLIPLELGGTNSLPNLWPQPRSAKPWNSVQKDQVEKQLNTEVCSGQIDLDVAQREIASDWIAAYSKRFGSPAR